MDNDNKSIFLKKVNRQFMEDCILRSVSVRFDRMPDNSWRRIASDKPLGWIVQNTDKIISAILSVRNNLLQDELTRWGKNQRLEIDLELRDDKTTYLFHSEMEAGYLDYFTGKYSDKVEEI